MNQRARDLAVVLRGLVASLGPSARSLSVSEFSTWTLIRAGVIDEESLRALAVDLGLKQARTERRGRIWWRETMSREGGLVVIAAGPYRDGVPPVEDS